jgi:hypothetical protein
MVSEESARKLAIAQAYYRERLAGDRNVPVVAVVGSVSRGLATRSSDTDIALFDATFLGDVQLEDVEYRGESISLERHSLAAQIALSDHPLVDQRRLREFGRFCSAIVLEDRDGLWQSLSAKWGAALLERDAASALFDSAWRNLRAANIALDDLPLCYWHLYGAVSALATLALSLTEIRFQKPQWIIDDLRRAGFFTLVQVYQQLLMAEGPGFTLVNWKEQLSVLGFENWRTRTAEHDLDLVNENAEDVVSFHGCSDVLAWAQMAFYVLRLVVHYAQSRAIDGASTSQVKAVTSALLRCDPERANKLIHQLANQGDRLIRAYAERYTPIRV